MQSLHVRRELAMIFISTLLIFGAIISTPAEAAVTQTWNVSQGETWDVRGNVASIYCFSAWHWGEAREWLVNNYKDGWPHGAVKDDRPAIYLGAANGMAIAANALRESSVSPTAWQGSRSMSSDISKSQAIERLRSAGTSSGCAYGIIQWDGGRRLNFANFCRASDLDPRTLESQLLYMAYEYYASPEYRSYSWISNYTQAGVGRDTVKAAADSFRSKVLRGGSKGANNGIIDSWGNKWSSSWGAKDDGGLYAFLRTFNDTGVVPR